MHGGIQGRVYAFLIEHEQEYRRIAREFRSSPIPTNLLYAVSSEVQRKKG